MRRELAGCGALALLLAAGGCGDAAPAERWAGTMDTLQNGAVLVSNPASGMWAEGGGWTLVEELRIGSVEGDGPEIFGQVYGIAADERGQIWVLDRQARELRVFDARGGHVRTLGREGGGPLEFRDPIGLARSPDGTIWVADPGNNRYSIWNQDGTHAENRQRPIAGYMVPWPGMVDGEGRLVDIGSGAEGRVILLFDHAGAAVDSLPMPRLDGAETFSLQLPGGGSMTASVPFTPGISSTLDPRGFLWSGRSERYRLVQQELRGGDTVRIIERAWQPAPVTREDRERAVEGLAWFTDQGGRIDAGRIPSTKPAFATLMVDDRGHLWVAPPRGEGEPGRVFDLFDPEGRYLGVLRTPVTINPLYTHFAGDHLYTVATDELDVPYVVRMRIERGGG
jgi:hypothetical protein